MKIFMCWARLSPTHPLQIIIFKEWAFGTLGIFFIILKKKTSIFMEKIQIFLLIVCRDAKNVLVQVMWIRSDSCKILLRIEAIFKNPFLIPDGLKRFKLFWYRVKGSRQWRYLWKREQKGRRYLDTLIFRYQGIPSFFLSYLVF